MADLNLSIDPITKAHRALADANDLIERLERIVGRLIGNIPYPSAEKDITRGDVLGQLEDSAEETIRMVARGHEELARLESALPAEANIARSVEDALRSPWMGAKQAVSRRDFV